MPQEMSFGEALVSALGEVLEQDKRVVLIGGGLVSSGPAQAQFARLRQKFASRMKSPPIAEIGFCGIAAGAAMAGLRPLVDIGTATFSYEAIPQIVNEAAIAYSNSGGQINVPVTYFMRYGIRGKGLLRTALLKSQDPTIFFAHERLMNLRGPVPDGEYEIPFGKAEVKREGRDVTIIATGVQVPRALAAADALAKDGISAEVVDPRTLEPLDKGTLITSVKKTGRLVITDESHDNCSVASGLAAIMADEAFASLRAPIKRVTIPHGAMKTRRISFDD